MNAPYVYPPRGGWRERHEHAIVADRTHRVISADEYRRIRDRERAEQRAVRRMSVVLGAAAILLLLTAVALGVTQT